MAQVLRYMCSRETFMTKALCLDSWFNSRNNINHPALYLLEWRCSVMCRLRLFLADNSNKILNDTEQDFRKEGSSRYHAVLGFRSIRKTCQTPWRRRLVSRVDWIRWGDTPPLGAPEEEKLSGSDFSPSGVTIPFITPGRPISVSVSHRSPSG